MEKLCLRLPGRRTYNFWNSDFLIFPTFKQILLRILWKNFQVSKYILKVLIKFYRFTNIYDLKFFGNETTALWILLILLKCTDVTYSNGNESFTSRLFSNYRPFFDISFIVFFTRLLSESLWRNYPFSAEISKIHVFHELNILVMISHFP